MQQGEADVLADVVNYSRNMLAPLRTDPGFRDHWFDDVKIGFDTLWCAVARLELMLHCGKTSEEVGGPVLVTRADADAIASELQKACPDFGGPYQTVMLLVKRPPPGAPPFGSRP